MGWPWVDCRLPLPQVGLRIALASGRFHKWCITTVDVGAGRLLSVGYIG